MKPLVATIALCVSAAAAFAAQPTSPPPVLTPPTPNVALATIDLCITPEDPNPLPTLDLDFFEPGEACGCRLWWLVQVCTPMPEGESLKPPEQEKAAPSRYRP